MILEIQLEKGNTNASGLAHSKRRLINMCQFKMLSVCLMISAGCDLLLLSVLCARGLTCLCVGKTADPISASKSSSAHEGWWREERHQVWHFFPLEPAVHCKCLWLSSGLLWMNASMSKLSSKVSAAIRLTFYNAVKCNILKLKMVVDDQIANYKYF